MYRKLWPNVIEKEQIEQKLSCDIFIRAFFLEISFKLVAIDLGLSAESKERGCHHA